MKSSYKPNFSIQILWSDPITDNEYAELKTFMPINAIDETGYMSNQKRSTAFYFSQMATDRFLKKNNLTHVLRAHEVVSSGFKFNHTGKVITVFSCSRYCGGTNKAAALLVEGFEKEGFIKTILLGT